MRTTTILLCLLTLPSAFAQVTVPDGTKLRVRLDQAISSATADEGQVVELSIAEAVKVGDTVVFPEGSRVTGTVTLAQAKRRMGRSGKLDFSIDRARAADGEWVPLRYLLNKKAGESHAVRTGVLTAGAAIVFWPAAPFFLLMHGKDTTINKGVTFDVFTDTNHELHSSRIAAAPVSPAPAAPVAPQASAQVAITSPSSGADIEVDGLFAGNTPTTLQMPAGTHEVVVKSGAASWHRTISVSAGSTVSINAQLESGPQAARRQ